MYYKPLFYFSFCLLSVFGYGIGIAKASDVILTCTSLTGTQPSVTCNFASKTITSVLEYRQGVYPANPSTCATGGGTGTITGLLATAKGSCTDSDYWVKVIVGGTNYIVQWYYLGGVWAVGGFSNIPTRISTLTASTTTRTITITGYINATTTSGIYERLLVYQTGLITDSYSDLLLDITATTTGYFSRTFDYRSIQTSTATTTQIIAGSSTINAFIYQYNNAYFVEPFGLPNPLYRTLLVSTSTNLSTATGTLITIRDILAYPEYECAITSLTGCFKNALIWAFYPDQTLYDNFNDFSTTLKTKAPFGYFSQVVTSVNGITATTTPTVFIVIPAHIKSVFFTPFDTKIAGILWVMFLFGFYKRLKHITI